MVGPSSWRELLAVLMAPRVEVVAEYQKDAGEAKKRYGLSAAG